MAGKPVKRIIRCPKCKDADSLSVYCTVPVKYEIEADGQWCRDVCDGDDDAVPYEVTCVACGASWEEPNIESDGHGLLRLGDYTADDYGQEIEV